MLGPLIAAGLLWQLPALVEPRETYALAFWLTLIPGLGAALTFALLVREQRFAPKPGLRLGASLAAMPRGYRRFLVGVGVFGLGDFSHTLLILAATAHLTSEAIPAAVLAILLYAWRNFVQALAAFPAGWLGDRLGHRPVLLAGYALASLAIGGFAWLIPNAPDWLAGWIVLFALAGVYMAIQESLEPAIVAELVPDKALHGTAYGALAAVNGFGDVGASLMVGWLVLSFGWSAGLLYAAAMMLAGTAALAMMLRK